MFNFFKLVHNENSKIYSRPRVWIMSLILIVLLGAISGIWRWASGGGVNMWEVVLMETLILFMLITIYAVIIGASSVSDEFNAGTIKLLLVRPWSRSMILLSKYISVVLFSVFQVLLLAGSSILINWICFDLLGGSTPEVSELMSIIGISSDYSLGQYLLHYYLLQFVVMLMIVTLAFMLSTVFRSGALAIGFSLFVLLGINSLAGLIAALPYKWIDYLLFIHMNLVSYLNPAYVGRGGMTLSFSLYVLGGYYVLFMAIAWVVFNRRDVAT